VLAIILGRRWSSSASASSPTRPPSSPRSTHSWCSMRSRRSETLTARNTRPMCAACRAGFPRIAPWGPAP
jgi:hypothetical protein